MEEPPYLPAVSPGWHTLDMYTVHSLECPPPVVCKIRVALHASVDDARERASEIHAQGVFERS